MPGANANCNGYKFLTGEKNSSTGMYIILNDIYIRVCK